MDNILDELKVLITAETAPLKKELSSLQSTVGKQTNAMSKAFGKIGTIIRRIAATVALGKIGKDALSLASDAAETEAVVDLAFGNMRHHVDEFAKSAIQQFGMSGTEAKQTAGEFMLMSKGMGLVGEDAAKMAVNVAGFSSDLASLKNTSQEVAKTALTGIWTGETEALKKYGIVMTQANLSQFALRQGMSGNIQAMSQQEQIMLRYSYIMDAMGMATGNFARESQGWAGQVKILSSQWKELLTIIGQGLMVVLLPVLKFINAVMAYLIRFAQVVAAVFSKLFNIGKKSNAATSIGSIGNAASSAGTGVGNLNSNLGKLGNAGKSVGKGAKGMDKLGKSAEKAGKKAKGALASFDSLNVLTNPDSGSSSSSSPSGLGSGGLGSGGIGGIGGAGIGDFGIPDMYDFGTIPGPEIDTTNIEKFIDKVKTKLAPFINTIKSINFKPLIEAFKGLWNAIKPILMLIGDNIAWLLNNILAPFAKWFIEEIAPRAIDIISASFNLLLPILKAVSDAGKWVFETFLLPIAKFTAPIFQATMDFVIDALNSIADWATNNQSLLQDLALIVGSFAAAWGLVNGAIGIWNGIGIIATGITTAFGAAVGFLTSPIGIAVSAIGAIIAVIVLLTKHWDKVKEVAAKVWEAIKNTWSKVATWFNVTVVQPVISFFKLLWDNVKTFASNAWSAIKTIWQVVKDWFTNNVINPVLSTFSTLWNGVKSAASNAWGNVKTTWNSVKTWFTNNVKKPISDVFTSLWDGVKTKASDTWNSITGLFSKGGRIFNGVVDGISGIFKRMVNAIIRGINSVISTPFKAINTLLNKIRSISFLGLSPFKSLWGVSPLTVPRIPQLAVGTNYVARDGLAMIHQGEAVVPKKYNPALGGNQDQVELLREQNSLLRMLLEKDTNLILDGDKINQAMNLRQKRQNERYGYAY